MFLIYILFFVFENAFGEINYCENFGPTHTMCAYKEISGCSLISSGVDEEAIKDILTAHNDLRLKVAAGKQSGQPKASNMKEVIWDVQLAVVAQRWANQCNFKHDTNRKTESFPHSPGQNIAEFVSSVNENNSISNFNDDAIKGWFGEVENFYPNNIEPFKFELSTDHYTQVVWADTYAVGCGFTYYKDRNFFTKYYVCNYGPRGNVVGGSMYKIGKPCSACQTTCSKDFPGLCQASSTEMENQ